MYVTLLTLHSFFRWLVLLSLVISLFRAYRGYRKKTPFSSADNAWRHWTATIAHIQLTLGVLLYSKSPLIPYFWKNVKDSVNAKELSFFGLYHLLLMVTAVVLITIGSALAKRRKTDQEKYRTMGIYFGIGLFLILCAIPWPFSPLAQRPYFRQF